MPRLAEFWLNDWNIIDVEPQPRSTREGSDGTRERRRYLG